MSSSIIRLSTENIKDNLSVLHAGDMVLLSGAVYTARDAAHKRIDDLLNQNLPLPFPLSGAVLYYAGPTQPKGRVIGSCGPTTSGRMDVYTPRLLSLGLCGMIGKGRRSQKVMDAISRYGAVYFCAVGGVGAFYADCVLENKVIAFEDLGCESVKRLVIKDFPLLVAADIYKGDIYDFL